LNIRKFQSQNTNERRGFELVNRQRLVKEQSRETESPRSRSKVVKVPIVEAEPETRLQQWATRFFKYLIFILMALLVIIVLLGYFFANMTAVSRCCDFSREFLMFNTKVYNEDGPLPF